MILLFLPEYGCTAFVFSFEFIVLSSFNWNFCFICLFLSRDSFSPPLVTFLSFQTFQKSCPVFKVDANVYQAGFSKIVRVVDGITTMVAAFPE